MAAEHDHIINPRLPVGFSVERWRQPFIELVESGEKFIFEFELDVVDLFVMLRKGTFISKIFATGEAFYFGLEI